ncbi:hypothetical protein DFO67_108172 [Modicisalibacter xianhensis]|uniref:Uncharacterized protein n=1 Tax=Modicisalibacter xianhensis TaxID=442341 RepID=A0A4V3GU29_9GAMM|nr:hypothetical protein [Halomonas xianhensis]TDX29128.1 hypothetical protein DFO67_108172 [Halomonas xianhensis]
MTQLRRPSTIRCPACGLDKPIGKMTVATSRYERQILTECKDCQLSVSRINRKALAVAGTGRSA